MLPQLYFFVSIAFGFIAWGIVTTLYIWPRLRPLRRTDALRPLLILHSFRFIGLAFLVPGVASPDLPSAFAHSAAHFIPTLIVPLMLITHGLVFRILMRHQNEYAMQESRQPGKVTSEGLSSM